MFYVDLRENVILPFEPVYEGAMIGRIPDVYNEEELGFYVKLVKDLLLEVHFMVDSEDSNNLDFLHYILNNVGKYGDVSQVDDNIRTLMTEGLYSAVHIYDCGYQQFRCSSLELLLLIHKGFRDEGNN